MNVEWMKYLIKKCYIMLDVEKLKQLSSATGLNIITSTGFYVEQSHPDHVNEASIEELSEFMLKELEEGIEQTNVKAGIIGEIGTSTTITKNEEKVLRAAARCHKKGNYPISIHLANMKGREGFNVIKILDSEGANLEKVVLCHMDLALDLFSSASHGNLIMHGNITPIKALFQKDNGIFLLDWISSTFLRYN